MSIFKQLDKLVSKGFIGPYLISFLVAEFVLVLQFIWQHIDDFIGRGVSIPVIAEMIFYYSLTIIPLALPISILISSVMVYGNMAEKYELTSFKSAGVSLFRLMRPGILIAIATALFSIFASNYLKPNAFLSFYQIFDNVRRAKPTLTIDQGIFCYDFKGYAMRVGKKDKDGRNIEDVLIYDQTDRKLLGLITAERGEMYTSANGQYFTMELYNGVQYSEMERRDEKGKRDQDQFVRVYFEKFIKQFDMSEFEFALSNNSMGRRKHDLYNSFQMSKIIDSIDLSMNQQIEKTRHFYADLIEGKELEEEELEEMDEEEKSLGDKYSPKTEDIIQTTLNKEDIKIKDQQKNAKADNIVKQKGRSNRKKADRFYNERTSFRKKSYDLDTISSIAYTIIDKQKRNIIFRAKAGSQTMKERYRVANSTIGSAIYSRNRYALRLHQQMSWAVVCILFIFIGASFGSIVRKGGFGYPLLVAIVFFVIFIFSNILGEKLMSSGSISPILGAWLPCVILTPFAILFTVKAVRDSTFSFNFKSLFS